MITKCLEVQIEEFIALAIARDICESEEETRKKKRRRQETPDYWESTWGKMLKHKDIADPNSFVGKKFRRRFRVPYQLFVDIIIPKCAKFGILSVARERIPVEFKILAALRMLGRDSCADSVSELSFMGESTCNSIFKRFLKEFTEALYSIYVRPPEGEELQRVMERYRRLGFPGCVGSVDCTHVK
jgi:hypothetical protein